MTRRSITPFLLVIVLVAGNAYGQNKSPSYSATPSYRSTTPSYQSTPSYRTTTPSYNSRSSGTSGGYKVGQGGALTNHFTGATGNTKRTTATTTTGTGSRSYQLGKKSSISPDFRNAARKGSATNAFGRASGSGKSGTSRTVVKSGGKKTQSSGNAGNGSTTAQTSAPGMGSSAKKRRPAEPKL